MNSELIFESKKYISSKRASQLSGYNQDYIGQLIRDSKIEARRVGRHWFVSLESLEKQFEKTKGKTLPKGKGSEKTQNEEVHKPLYLEGKKFISSKEASDFSGYSRDYIGQLVRENKLEGKLVGRLWFISLPSLENHLEKQNGKVEEKVLERPVTAQKPEEKISKYEREIVSSLPQIPQKEKVTQFDRKISYPVYSQRKIISPFSHLKRVGIGALVAIVLVLGAQVVHYNLNKEKIAQNSQSILASASVVSTSSFESFALDWYKFINGKFIGVHKFFAGIFGSNKFAYVPTKTESKGTPQGVVVVPKDAEGQATIDRIKDSFSDKVGVTKNADGVTGLITPEFKKVGGDEYLYVLVPVKDKNND